MSALECHRTPLALVENVPDFRRWALFPAWCQALQALGYSVAPHVIDCADLGVPQNRERLFIALTRSAKPIQLELPRVPHVAAASFLDFHAGRWSPIEKPGRAAATLARIAKGRSAHGSRFLTSFYGQTKGGRSLHRPIGTITTRDRWAVIDGDRMRMITVDEAARAMSFRHDYQLPAAAKEAMHMLGNAVPPLAAQRVIESLRAVA